MPVPHPPPTRSTTLSRRTIGMPAVEKRQRGEGRLIFPTGHGLRSAIVRYCRTGDSVTIRIPEFNAVANYLDRAHVTLEPWPTGSVAAICGVATIVDDASSPAEVAAALETWPNGVAARFVVITPEIPSPLQ